MTTKYQVGDTLYWVPISLSSSDRWHGEVTIHKVGARWLTVRHQGIEHRVDPASLYVERSRVTGSYSARCWPSKKAYEEHLEVVVGWELLVHHLNKTRQPPANMAIERIREARKILGLDLPPPFALPGDDSLLEAPGPCGK